MYRLHHMDDARINKKSSSRLKGQIEQEIPLCNINQYGFNFYIGAHYTGGYKRSNNFESELGHNWFLNTGGAIKRQVNGVEDELKTDYPSSEIINGYLQNRNLISNDAPLQEIWNSFRESSAEPHPDEFSFNVLGVSGKFYHSRNGVHVICDQNVQVYPTISTQYGDPGEFDPRKPRDSKIILVLENGYRCEFGGNPDYLEWINRYDNDKKTIGRPIITTWNLKKIIAPNGNFTEYNYNHYNYDSPCNSEILKEGLTNECYENQNKNESLRRLKLGGVRSYEKRSFSEEDNNLLDVYEWYIWNGFPPPFQSPLPSIVTFQTRSRHFYEKESILKSVNINNKINVNFNYENSILYINEDIEEGSALNSNLEKHEKRGHRLTEINIEGDYIDNKKIKFTQEYYGGRHTLMLLKEIKIDNQEPSVFSYHTGSTIIEHHLNYHLPKNDISEGGIPGINIELNKIKTPTKGEIQLSKIADGTKETYLDDGKKLFEKTISLHSKNPDGTRVYNSYTNFSTVNKLGNYNINRSKVTFSSEPNGNESRNDLDNVHRTILLWRDFIAVGRNTITPGVILNYDNRSGNPHYLSNNYTGTQDFPQTSVIEDKYSIPTKFIAYFYTFDKGFTNKETDTLQHIATFNYKRYGRSPDPGAYRTKLLTEKNHLLEKRTYEITPNFNKDQLEEIRKLPTNELYPQSITMLDTVQGLQLLESEKYQYDQEHHKIKSITQYNPVDNISYKTEYTYPFDYQDDTIDPIEGNRGVYSELFYSNRFPVISQKNYLVKDNQQYLLSCTFNEYKRYVFNNKEIPILESTYTSINNHQQALSNEALGFDIITDINNNPSLEYIRVTDSTKVSIQTYSHFSPDGTTPRQVSTNTGQYTYNIYCHDFQNVALQIANIPYTNLVNIPFNTNATTQAINQQINAPNYIAFLEEALNTTQVINLFHGGTLNTSIFEDLSYDQFIAQQIDYLYQYIQTHYPKGRIAYTHFNNRFLIDYTLDARKQKISFEYDNQKRLITTRDTDGNIVNHTQYHIK